MHDWREFLIRHYTSVDGLDELAIASGLLVLAMLVLPRSQRRQLRLPLLLLGGYLLVIVGHRVLLGQISPHSKAAFISFALLLVSVTRITFLVVVDWLLARWLKREIPRIFRDILQAILFLAMTLVFFRSLGAELGSLLTTSAILTAVIGFSLQESLGNLVAGLAVRLEHPFAIGDWVELIDGQQTIGRVVEINWRATKLRSLDLFEIVVPNGLFAKATFRNYSRPELTTRRTIDFAGPYDVPPNEITSTVLAALRGTAQIQVTPAPRVWLSSFGDSGINYRVVFFLNDLSVALDAESEIRTRVWYALHRIGVGMPFPVRDVRIQQVDTPSQPEGEQFDADSRMQILQRVELFDGMPDTVRCALSEAADAMLYSTGESVVFEGDAGHDLFVVARGQVTVVTNSPSGDIVELARLGAGQLFGELSLLTGVRGATITASEQTVVLRIGHAEFRRIVSSIPGYGEALLTKLLERQSSFSRPEDFGLEPSAQNGDVRTALFEKIRRFFSG
jgi:small-conductance mechanosensitive channel